MAALDGELQRWVREAAAAADDKKANDTIVIDVGEVCTTCHDSSPGLVEGPHAAVSCPDCHGAAHATLPALLYSRSRSLPLSFLRP